MPILGIEGTMKAPVLFVSGLCLQDTVHSTMCKRANKEVVLPGVSPHCPDDVHI